ncbi:hypothetical protein AMTRI_Chr08g160410 [Amborella trichopoda]
MTYCKELYMSCRDGFVDNFQRPLLLVTNALAVLNEDRFLAPRSYSSTEVSGRRTKSMIVQLISFVYGVQVFRIPLILSNLLAIVVLIFSG